MNSIDQAFNEGYNEARNYYYNDQIEDYIKKSRELLANTAIPRYHQIRFLILLGATVEDWSEAKEYYTRAESIWCLVRRWQHPENEQALVEVYMADLRKALDELAQAIQEEVRTTIRRMPSTALRYRMLKSLMDGTWSMTSTTWIYLAT
jgi:hypothetical protein